MFFFFGGWIKLNPKYIFFGNITLWITSRATIWVVFEAGYEIKLLVIASDKHGDNTDIWKLQKCFILLFKSLLMNEWRSLIAHIYSVASIITKFMPKHPHSPIHSNRRRILSCWNHRHSSRTAFVNLLIYWPPCAQALLIEQSVNSLFIYMPPKFN